VRESVVRVCQPGGVLVTLERLRIDAAKCADALLWTLSDADLVTAVEQLHRLEQTLAAAKLHLIAEVDGREIPTTQRCRGTAAWLRSRLLLDAASARQLADLAAVLRRHPAVEAALCAGTIHVRQAAAICEAVDALPSNADLAAVVLAGSDADPWTGGDVGGATAADIDATACSDEVDPLVAADVAAAAEAALLEFAGDFAPAPLRQLGARILDHVAPQVAERLDAKALERAERRAWPERGFTLSPPISGRVRVSGHLTVEDAAIVSAALDPLSSPMPDADSRTPAQRRADALVETCRLALRTGQLPDSGGEPPQLAVTVAYDPLTRRFGVGRLDSGARVSPPVVRRLACDAQLLPIVLGGAGQVLDAGRARRLATGPLRRAMVVRDRGCAFPTCDRPPRWCDGHHVVPWTAGGPTRLDNLVLLCRQHHRLLHHGDWTVRIAADGLPEFLPPPVPGEPHHPRRNRYHRRT
jgi:hypothetical protein